MLARIKSYETRKKMHFSSGKMKGFWQLLNKLPMNWGIFWVIHRFSLHAQPSCWYFYAAGILGMAGNYLGFCITWNPHTCAHKFVMSVLSIIRPGRPVVCDWVLSKTLWSFVYLLRLCCFPDVWWKRLWKIL